MQFIRSRRLNVPYGAPRFLTQFLSKQDISFAKS